MQEGGAQALPSNGRLSDMVIPRPIKSTGGATDYYRLPEGATELNDLIEAKRMCFALGNIFKACYRLGEKQGTDVMYDLEKMAFFVERLKGMARRGLL